MFTRFTKLMQLLSRWRAYPRTYRLCVAGLWLAVGAYTVWFSVLVLHRHDQLGTTIFDLGIYDQAEWLISHGHAPFLTTRGLYPLHDHFAPVIYLLAPLYWIHSSTVTLLLFQVVVLALGAVPLFHLAHERSGAAPLALLVSVSYLLYPALQLMNVFDFHPECLAPLLLLLAFRCLQKQAWKPFFVSVLFLLLLKETMGLTVICLGVYVACTASRRAGVATALIGAAGLTVAMTTVRLLNHGQPSQYLSFYSAYGNSIPSIAAFILTHPLGILADVGSEVNSDYLIALLGPVSFLALAAPDVFVLAFPALLANMLSDRPSMHAITHQYNSIIIPVLFVATVEGMEIGARLFPRAASKTLFFIRILLAVLLACGSVCGIFLGPLWQPIGLTDAPRVPANIAAGAVRALILIPDQASVSAQTAIGAHLAHRKRLYMFPNPFQDASWGNSPEALQQQQGRAIPILPVDALHERLTQARIDYIVLGPAGSSCFPMREEAYAHLVSVALADSNYGVIWAGDGMVILRYGSDHGQGLKLLRQAWPTAEVQLPRNQR